MAKGMNRDDGREAKWRGIIRRHAGAGVTIRQFCRDNDLAESAFYFWRRELQRRDASREQRACSQGPQRMLRQASAPAFVPVSVAEDQAPALAGIEIVLPGGARIRVADGVQRQALADVVAVLREACAC